MKTTARTINFMCRMALAIAASTLFLTGTVWSQDVWVEDIVIRYRPLTPQEITAYGLHPDTQKSGGAPNAGIGQPVYLEAIIHTSRFPIAVNWTLIDAPPGSTAMLQDSPISNNVPAYDTGDREEAYFVGGRTMLKPDLLCSYDFIENETQSYKIRADIVLTNETISFTNEVFGSLYLGQKHYLCVLCHSNKQSDFDMTAHATAFTEQINGAGSDHFNPNCISCHVLGYDTADGATNGGFDDIALQTGWTFPAELSPTNWANMPTNLQHKANVQCENCHGAASTHMVSLGNTNAIDVSLSVGTCGQCHDKLTHHVKPFEWGQSLHANGYVFRFSGSCVPCHSSKGFIEHNDPVYANSPKEPRGTTEEGIGCAACHDPHTVGMGEHQLRSITTAVLSNGVIITEAQAGEGVLCMNCHHAREDVDVAIAGSANSRFGPHHGPRGDMLAGQNAYEYGKVLPRSRHMQAVTNTCVGCHMQLIGNTSFAAANTKVGGHTFKMHWDNDTPGIPGDDYYVTEVCNVCHVEYNTFDFGGDDYDRDGIVEGVQTEISGLLEHLGRLLPPLGSPDVVTGGSYDTRQKRAAWNYRFVEEDKSLGVHNPKYAAALLQASIDDLTGGIDVDRDGLLDEWEMIHFGNLTSQSGSDDYDQDGLNNAAEQAAGTNPKEKDSDFDSYWDLAELQAGTDPWATSSIPENVVFQMLPAVELGYMPETMGITQQFQAIDVMKNDGTWTDLGNAFISSNAVQYQLVPLRGSSTQQFFRVIKP